MVVRHAKRNRKYHGTRRWGVGNIKNARGAGGRGGVGEIARLRKHDWTYITAKRPDLIRKKGFTPRNRIELKEITLDRISESVARSKESTIDLKGFKVLSNGSLTKPAKIRANGFSKQAIEKIKGAGGEAIVLELEAKEQAKA